MGETITVDFKELKRQLAAVIRYMDNFEISFDKDPEGLTRMMSSIKANYERMIEVYGKEEVERYRPEIDFYIKQISEKFDNMTEQKISERDRTATEIRELVNRKQIVNYQR